MDYNLMNLTEDFFKYKMNAEKNKFHSDFMPKIDLVIHGMKESIISRMGLYGSEFGDIIEKKIEEIIKNFPFDDYMENTIETTIKEAIEEFFEGEMKNILKLATTKALHEAAEEYKNRNKK